VSPDLAQENSTFSLHTKLMCLIRISE